MNTIQLVWHVRLEVLQRHATLGGHGSWKSQPPFTRQTHSPAVLQEMRELFARLEGEGYKAEDQEHWRNHWDFQLYKALEIQYAKVR